MPLPNPNSNESRGDFVDRCVIDNNIVNDFNTIQQRIAVCNSLYEQEKQIKQVKDTWQSAFENELTKAERSSNRDFYLYYQAEYDKAIKMFLSQGGISMADVQVFFKEDTLIKMYSEMYAKVGLQFARWYSKNFDKFISKSVNLKDYESIWQANFAFIGSQVGGQRVSGVSGTAKQTIISVIQKLMKDPEFQIQGERVKARILKFLIKCKILVYLNFIMNIKTNKLSSNAQQRASRQLLSRSKRNLILNNSLKIWSILLTLQS